MTSQVLLASRNPGKVREWESILAGLPIEVLTLAEGWDHLPDAVEDGSTFAENARLKALHFMALTGLPTIGEDSGLEVEALGGRPGVWSARYGPDDPARIRRLLSELAGVPPPRPARFVCALCLALPDGRRLEVEGDVRGLITLEPRGSGGFGYDPVFYYPPAACTFAELPPERKNEVSHRAAAFRSFAARLSEFLGWRSPEEPGSLS
ncbi:MAG: RdgB/HAM1 family non-canonical purine NTP pyrophosphatase [Acidobacteriota bacterium]